VWDNPNLEGECCSNTNTAPGPTTHYEVDLTTGTPDSECAHQVSVIPVRST
jgi:hypothetical protein